MMIFGSFGNTNREDFILKEENSAHIPDSRCFSAEVPLRIILSECFLPLLASSGSLDETAAGGVSEWPEDVCDWRKLLLLTTNQRIQFKCTGQSEAIQNLQ
ncbi:uncharacterized protein [Macrobrachium rosenbergii]|uniref:uncharacterized protein n=1 Tax=Macrobrachium rosenbergii TaxID=79674 RepID=UPI0034D750C1